MSIYQISESNGFLADVVAGKKYDRLQFADQHLEEAGVAAVEQLHPADGLEVDVEGHVRHHLPRQIPENLPLVKTLLCVPGKLAPSLHPLDSLGGHLVRLDEDY